jgi:peptidoglycan/xylan/chitin deacetylase (PgdA/CDA1 family)
MNRLKSDAKNSIRWLVGSVARWVGVLCLNYHRIGDGRSSIFDRGLWSATPEGFDRQLRWLKAHLDVISPADLPHVLRVKRGRHVVLTFDDGYEDNYTAAYPILRAHRLQATFFVATGFIDEPRLPWWDEIAWMVRRSERRSVALPAYMPAPISFDEPDRAGAVRALLWTYYRLPTAGTGQFLDALGEATGSGRYGARSVERVWMTWDMLREMRAGGMTIGGHTVNHPILSRMPREEQWKEISGCGRRLEEELGDPMRIFSYPAGQRDSFNSDTRECLREAGVQTAFTYSGGFRRLSQWDDYDVPRSAVEQDTTFEEFRGMVMAPWLTRA